MSAQPRRLRLLFIHNAMTQFMRLDIAILQQAFEVSVYDARQHVRNPLDLLSRVAGHDVLLGWFASWHTFLPLLYGGWLGKPSVLIIGGYDLANQPAIGYGCQRGGLRKWVSCRTMRLATRLVTNSYYSLAEAETNAGIRPAWVRVIHHGLPDPYQNQALDGRRDLVLSVGNVERANLQRKGHELFVRTAQLVPEMKFCLVGKWVDDAADTLRKLAPPNLALTGWVSDEELLALYRRASVYMQASTHEAFGMSVAESMLAGVIPVITQSGSLPEVVGDCGIYASAADPPALAKAIRNAARLPYAARIKARQRVLLHFPLEKRARALIAAVSELCPAQP